MEKLKKEIRWWKKQMRKAQKEKKNELDFICWGIATGLMLAKEIIDEGTVR